MPNQRAKNKVRLGGFLDRRLYQKITLLARREGMADNKFRFVQQLLNESMARHRDKGKPHRSRRVRAATA